jgi:molybdopterin-guanine dinucleotide biosynthesis protein A
MGGAAKGLLLAPDGERIVERTRRLLAEAGASCVLVGEHPAYGGLGLRVIADDPSASGPLAGMLALLSFAAEARAGHAIAVACDMPLLTADLVRRLVEAPAAAIVAPRHHDPERGWLWEPLFARYDAEAVLPVARGLVGTGRRRLQDLLDAAGARPLELTANELAALVDWDTPDALPSAPMRGKREA